MERLFIYCSNCCHEVVVVVCSRFSHLLLLVGAGAGAAGQGCAAESGRVPAEIPDAPALREELHADALRVAENHLTAPAAHQGDAQWQPESLPYGGC